MTMDPDTSARRPFKLTPIIAEVAGKRFGRGVGRRLAKPIAELLREYFDEDVLRRLTGDVTNPLLAFGIDAAWVLVAETMNPERIVDRDGRGHDITDEAWEGFVLELQHALKERHEENEMAKPPKPPAGAPTPPPPPKPNPVAELAAKAAVDLLADPAARRKAARELDAQASVARNDARGLERVNQQPSFWDWVAQLGRDLRAWWESL